MNNNAPKGPAAQWAEPPSIPNIEPGVPTPEQVRALTDESERASAPRWRERSSSPPPSGCGGQSYARSGAGAGATSTSTSSAGDLRPDLDDDARWKAFGGVESNRTAAEILDDLIDDPDLVRRCEGSPHAHRITVSVSLPTPGTEGARPTLLGRLSSAGRGSASSIGGQWSTW